VLHGYGICSQLRSVGFDSLSDIAVLKLIGKLPELRTFNWVITDMSGGRRLDSRHRKPLRSNLDYYFRYYFSTGKRGVEPLTFQNFIPDRCSDQSGEFGWPPGKSGWRSNGNKNTLIFSETGGLMGCGLPFQ
jgi:hypothetical protein